MGGAINMNIDKQLVKLVTAFVAELRMVVETATRDEVADALRKAVGNGAARAGRGRGKRGAAVVVDPGSRFKRTPRQMEGQAEKLYDYIKSHPGERMEQICDGLGMKTNLLQPLAKRLIAEKRLKAKGKARGTTYTVA
jgi:hypothetical protein